MQCKQVESDLEFFRWCYNVAKQFSHQILLAISWILDALKEERLLVPFWVFVWLQEGT